MSIWDDPELKTAGNFMKFDNVGDSVTGRINAIRRQRFDDGTMCPQLLLTQEDGTEVAVTCGQIRLKMALVEQRPEEGDDIRITLAQVERRAGGKTLKHFTVDVRRNHAAPASQPADNGFANAPAATAAGGFGGAPQQAAQPLTADPWANPAAPAAGPQYASQQPPAGNAGTPPF